MGVPGNANALLLRSAAAAGGYQVSRSLRFNSSDSAYLSRTPASAGNRRTATWAGWVKRSTLGAAQAVFSLGAFPTNIFEILFNSDDTFIVQNSPNSATRDLFLITTALYRDASAWYHVVVSVDTTQATSTNRVKIYINGLQVTAFSTATYPSQNTDLNMNTAVSTQLGRRADGNFYFNGYLADIHFIDGQALTPSSFAETDATTGQWIPKAFSGSYGTNGFRLPFSDNSGTTSTTLGKDAAGSNNWSPNNFSVASGSGNDSLVDTPTSYGTDTGAGGEVRGNYATLNPLAYGGDIQAPTNGNLDVTSGTSSDGSILGTFGMSSGKWYFEVTCNNTSTSGIGIAKSGVALADYPGQQPEAWVVQTQTPFYKVNNNIPTALTGTFNSGDVIGVAFDADNGNLSFYQNGSVIGSNAFTGLTNGPYLPIVGDSNSTPSISLSCNFGQRAFAYTAPSGFKALCDTNLTAPTIAKPNTVFDVKLYTGTAATQSITGLGFSPDFVWIKNRNGTAAHHVFDIVRGATKRLITNGTQDDSYNAYDSLTSFDTSGFTLGADTSTGCVNNPSGATYVAWAWDAGSSTVSNTQGSITSQVRANASAGFSIVTYTGTGSNATVGHGLGVAPELIIVKRRSATGSTANWAVWHGKLTAGQNLFLNTTDSASAYSPSRFTSTLPTSTVFSLGTADDSNYNTGTFVAYCFAPVAGYSSFGIWQHNNSNDGPFIYTGFRPQLILLKNSDNVEQWFMFDSARRTYNLAAGTDTSNLRPNSSGSEGSYSNQATIDFLSNGFKIRTTQPDEIAFGTRSYVYAAWAESPFQYARAR